MTPITRAMLTARVATASGALRDSMIDELAAQDRALAPRIPRRERMCAYVRDVGQATAIVLRKMLPPPAELFPIGGLFVFGFVSYAVHLLWPVAALALGLWLSVLVRHAYRWCVKPRQMSWRGLIAINERKPRRKRFDQECCFLFGAAGVLGGLAISIAITAIGA